MLIVLTGKTASGKDTVKSILLKKYPNFKRVITTTSRTPRFNEKDGVDYHFLTRKEFENKVKNNDFLEYVEYGGNLYGTQKIELEQTLNQDTLWKIDPSRAGKIKEMFKNALVIYINASDDVILQRLKNRNLSETEIQQRMADDQRIWDQYKDNYNFIVENISGKLDEAVDKITKIIDSNPRG